MRASGWVGNESYDELRRRAVEEDDAIARLLVEQADRDKPKPKPGWLWRDEFRTDAGDDGDLDPRFSELIPGTVLDGNEIVDVEWRGGWVVVTFLHRGTSLPT